MGFQEITVPQSGIAFEGYQAQRAGFFIIIDEFFEMGGRFHEVGRMGVDRSHILTRHILVPHINLILWEKFIVPSRVCVWVWVCTLINPMPHINSKPHINLMPHVNSTY